MGGAGHGAHVALRDMDVSPAPACPMCDAAETRVVEDVSDEVTVYGCDECGTTWADRTDA